MNLINRSNLSQLLNASIDLTARKAPANQQNTISEAQLTPRKDQVEAADVVIYRSAIITISERTIQFSMMVTIAEFVMNSKEIENSENEEVTVVLLTSVEFVT
ncbi:MAG: hypothetical protein EZS28_025526 [Streblomastix strix]|uniref:Uncharacterized protein n=1 Tax=Streblomastix strix TaxID=222440 RepID=A0A5J4V8W2_9EUKA|nr:MAG: hypothetical protein EZS28_025526 [Streblomastix strix]